MARFRSRCSRFYWTWALGSMSTAKRSTAREPWRAYGEGPTKVAGGSFHDTDTANYTAGRFSLHHQGRHALCDRTCLAGKWRSGRPLAGRHRGKRTGGVGGFARRRPKLAIRAESGWFARVFTQFAAGKVCLRASREVSARGPLKRTSTESLREKRHRNEAFLCFVSDDDETQGAVKKVQRMKSFGASVYSVTSSRRPKPFDGAQPKSMVKR